MTSDIWVPKGGAEVAKTNPGAFIRRISNATLEFEGTGADISIRLIPLKEVMAEKYEQAVVDHNHTYMPFRCSFSSPWRFTLI